MSGGRCGVGTCVETTVTTSKLRWSLVDRIDALTSVVGGDVAILQRRALRGSSSWFEYGAPTSGIAPSCVIRLVAVVCLAMAQKCAVVRERNWTIPARELLLERATGNGYQETAWTHLVGVEGVLVALKIRRTSGTLVAHGTVSQGGGAGEFGRETGHPVSVLVMNKQINRRLQVLPNVRVNSQHQLLTVCR